MVKKIIAILFCSIACVIHFAHSAIPHTHTADQKHDAHSHHHHHSDNGDSDDNSIVHFFSHFGHSAEVFTHHPIEDVGLAKIDAVKPACICVHSNISGQIYSNNHALHKIPNIGYVYISPHLLSVKFRGPPAV